MSKKEKHAKKAGTVKKLWKKFWWFIWEDNSIWSWIANIVLAFVLIKFIVYPGLGFLLATSHPIVAVVSGSMEHEGNFDTWWGSPALCNQNTIKCSQADHYTDYMITEEQFKHFPYKNGFNKGDIMILYGTKPAKVKVGDIIVFMADRPDPIIHRVVAITKDDDTMIFSTKGDHNPTSFAFEKTIDTDTVIGTAKLRLPLLGYIKLGFVELVNFIKNIF
ncbi:MAG: signal peptidase I [Nanoarchaeota archaeon]|nr:signal peptidase I [Nanoarchaeota archaeon]